MHHATPPAARRLLLRPLAMGKQQGSRTGLVTAMGKPSSHLLQPSRERTALSRSPQGGESTRGRSQTPVTLPQTPPSHPNATSPRSPECCRPPAGGVGCWIDEWFCGPRSSASPRWRRRSAPASPGEGESAAVSGGPTGTTTPNSTSTGHVPKPPQLQGLPSSMEGAALSLAWVAKAHRGKSSSPVRPPSCSPSPAPLRTPQYSPVMPQHTAH